MNDRHLPFYEAKGIPILLNLTDRGTEYCGNSERHVYELCLALNYIEHAKTQVKSPLTNGICERFLKPVLDKFYRMTFREKIYQMAEEFQRDLDEWFDECNKRRGNQGRRCEGRPLHATPDVGMAIFREKVIAA